MTHPAVRHGEDRVVTVPNVITVVRLLCLPVFAALLASGREHGWLAAAFLLGALGITDGVDGWVARHFHQVSRLGKVIDPIADRALLGVAAVGTILVGAVPLWVALVVLVREGAVAAGAALLAVAGARRIDVQWAGKAGTFGLMVAMPLFLAGHAPVSWHAIAEALAWVAVGWGMALGWYAAITYVPTARTAMARRRGGVGAGAGSRPGP